MNPFSYAQECFSRVFCRKKTLLALLLVLLCSTVCGIVFIKTPSVYEFHFRNCDRFMAVICFSSRSVFLIFLERSLSAALLLLLVCLGGIHPAALVFVFAVLLFRGYTFGGSICIFFTVYGFTGAIVAFLLYLPVHLALDALFVFAGVLAFARAPAFCFCRASFWEAGRDFIVFLALVLVVCFAEMMLLAIFFHPIGLLL